MKASSRRAVLLAAPVLLAAAPVAAGADAEIVNASRQFCAASAAWTELAEIDMDLPAGQRLPAEMRARMDGLAGVTGDMRAVLHEAPAATLQGVLAKARAVVADYAPTRPDPGCEGYLAFLACEDLLRIFGGEA